MRLSTMTNFLRSLYGDREALAMIARAGFDAVDWSVFDLSAGDALICFPNYRERALAVRHMAEDCGMTVSQCHAPFRFDFASESGRASAIEMTVRCIEAASVMGVRTLVIHPLHYRRFRQNAALVHTENLAFYRSLLSRAAGSGVILCAENMWQWDDNGSAIAADACSDPEEFSALIDALGSPQLAACLDLGHAAVTEKETGCTPGEFIRRLGHDRLQALHIHDSDGSRDLHTAPYLGTIRWDDVLSALREIRYTGDFTFEADPFLERYPREFLPEALRFLHDTGRMMMKKLF